MLSKSQFFCGIQRKRTVSIYGVARVTLTVWLGALFVGGHAQCKTWHIAHHFKRNGIEQSFSLIIIRLVVLCCCSNNSYIFDCKVERSVSSTCRMQCKRTAIRCDLRHDAMEVYLLFSVMFSVEIEKWQRVAQYPGFFFIIIICKMHRLLLLFSFGAWCGSIAEGAAALEGVQK